MPHDHRLLEAERLQQSVGLLGGAAERRRLAVAAAVRRQVNRDARNGAVQLLDDRPPRAAVEGQPVQEDDRRARPLDVVGQSGLQVCRVAITYLLGRFRYIVT
jgi:hypothetical protein